jgi:hypothetical protein
MTDQTDRNDDVAETERKLREHEREARERESHERRPQEDSSPGSDRPAPPGPESQQPRG